MVNIGRLISVQKSNKRGSRERSAFGLRMLEARTRAGLTQTDVREKLGISQSNLSDLEGPAEGSAFTAQLANLYGCDGHWLATGFGEPGYRDRPASGAPLSFGNLNAFEAQLVTFFRQLSPEVQHEVLTSMNSMLPKAAKPAAHDPFPGKRPVRGMSVFDDLQEPAKHRRGR